MRPLFTAAELLPAAAVPGFAERYAGNFDSLPVGATAALTVVEASAADRLWALLELVAPGLYRPDPLWCSETLLDVFTQELAASQMPSALTPFALPRSTPVFIATEWGDATVAADWGFYLDHIVTVPTVSAVAPPDASWILGNHYGEFVTIYRTTFSHIREIVFTECFPRHDGVAVPKPQYFIRFDDGTHWLSGDLRLPPLRKSYDGLLATIADLAGMKIGTVDVLPEALARPLRAEH